MKYKFTGKTKNPLGRELRQIVALISFGAVMAGDVGGWIEGEANLSQTGDAWVYGDAWVFSDALVSGDALVFSNARVYGDALVYGDAWVSGDARVYGNAWVSKTPKLLAGFCHGVTITDHHIRVGCEMHPPSVWADRGAAIIKADGHSSKDAKRWAKIINLIAEAHGCVDVE